MGCNSMFSKILHNKIHPYKYILWSLIHSIHRNIYPPSHLQTCEILTIINYTQREACHLEASCIEQLMNAVKTLTNGMQKKKSSYASMHKRGSFNFSIVGFKTTTVRYYSPCCCLCYSMSQEKADWWISGERARLEKEKKYF